MGNAKPLTTAIYSMPVVSDEMREQLIRVAQKRLEMYHAVLEAKKSEVRPRGGLELKVDESILMTEIVLAALTATVTKRLNDHEIRETVNALRDIAVTYGQTQQLRERIAHCIVPKLKGVGHAM